MGYRVRMAVIAGPLAILAIIISLLNPGLMETSDDKIEKIKIEVIYFGSWEGVLCSNENVKSISGFTRKTLIVFNPVGEDWTILFEAKKMDGTTSQLKVVVELFDGTLLREAQTTDPYGKVSINLDIR